MYYASNMLMRVVFFEITGSVQLGLSALCERNVLRKSDYLTFTFSNFADAFIQSNLQLGNT